ncbi:MAG: 3-hydroxyacyl-CoA dehydrogenase NAD-binding domain-containing protein [Aquisalimonadaceae bacterium]
MSEAVGYSLRDGIGVITVNNPPVNALGQAVRAGLVACLEQGLDDPAAKALVVIGGGRTFPAGADIREFGKPAQPPRLGDLIHAYESSDKLIVAAIHGTALGGGLEVALGCDYRIALGSAAVGLPEVKLGLLPGAGGTQRLPRLIGAAAALDIIVSGNMVKAGKAHKLGLIDVVVDDELESEAVRYANRLVAEGAPLRRLRDKDVPTVAPTLFEDFERSIAGKARGFLAPFNCIKAVRNSVELPFAEGMKRERELFLELMESPHSAAQRYAFFAEREVAKVPGIGKETPRRDVKSVAVLGAGTMGGGIAMTFANAGIPVRLLEVKQEALDKGLANIRRNYDNTARKGRLTQDQVDQRMRLIQPTLSHDDLKDADLVVEAVFESMAVKKDVFGKLDQVCKPGAILATNTSTLNINEIAAVTGRPHDVIGMHFFSPANVMRLLENVRGDKTADDVVATVMDLSRKIGKVAVCVGVCHGFVANRMLLQRQDEADALVAQGATPEQVDKVLFDFGFPMGPFAMADLAGQDVMSSINEERRQVGQSVPVTWVDRLVAMDRLGQKTGAGVFRYADGDRTPRPDPETNRVIEAYRKDEGITPREVSDQEVLERCLYVMVNEGAKILEEGIAARPIDVDMVWIHGFGFPVYRGGPMHWADHVGLAEILGRIEQLHRDTGESRWQPAALLKKLVAEDKGFRDL